MRYVNYLRHRYNILLRNIGSMFLVMGGLYLIPLLVLPFYPEEAALIGPFLIPSVLLMLLGGLLRWRFQPEEGNGVNVQEGMVVVVVVWIMVIVAGAIPFNIINDLNLTQALFESTSGWTTTGLTVVDVTQAPRIVLFFRSFTQMAGGAGFAIIALTLIPGGGAGLSRAEGRNDQLAPHIRQSAGIVLRIYIGYIVFGVLALYLAGMDWFDAVNHAFTAVSTGGFSTRPESIGYWDSVTIEAVLLVLQLLGALNMLTAYTILRGKFYPITRNGELRLVAVVLPVSALFLVTGVTWTLYPSLEKSLRVALFEATSALTGTGFSTVSYLGWQQFGWLILIVLMCIGGGGGSTSGGLKQYRVYTLFKALKWEVRRFFMPRHAINLPSMWHGDHQGFLDDDRVREVALFVFLYMLLLLVGTGLVALHGYELGESLFEFSSAIGTVGLSIGVTSVSSPNSLLWVQIIGMFLGRLEFFAVIIGVTKLVRDFWTLREVVGDTADADRAATVSRQSEKENERASERANERQPPL